MKKIIVVLITLSILVACSPKKEEYYNITFEDTTVAVGFDETSILNDSLHINSSKYHLDKKEREIVDYIEFYVKDLSDINIFIDEYKLRTSIKDTCSDLNGELINNKGNACVLHKRVGEGEDIIVMYGDILSDNIDEINRIEVMYKYEENN